MPETYLYTGEAIQRYLQHVNANGYFVFCYSLGFQSITDFLLETGNISRYLLGLYCLAAWCFPD